MAIPPRPRFHAILWSQVGAIGLILSGMSFYWLGYGGAEVPSTISFRVVGVICVVLLTIIVPAWMHTSVIPHLAPGGEGGVKPSLFEDNKNVGRLLWICFFTDLALLTYLVHITGGLTGSMYSGVFLMLPSVALLLHVDSMDTRLVHWLTIGCAAAILGSVLMSHFDAVEFDASKYKHAYDKALGAVSMEAVVLPLIQIAVIRFNERKRMTGGGLTDDKLGELG